MSDVPQSVGVMLGKGATLNALGKVWRVSAPDQNAKDRLEKLAMAFALLDVEKLEGTLPPASYDKAYGRALKSLSEYRTWGPGWQSVVFGRAHYFLWSLLQEAHPFVTEGEVKDIMAESPEGVAAAYAQVMPDFFRVLVEEGVKDVPKKHRAEARAKLMTELEPHLGDLVDRLTLIQTNSA